MTNPIPARPELLVGALIKCPHCGRQLQVVRVIVEAGSLYWAIQLSDGEWARYWPYGGSDN